MESLIIIGIGYYLYANGFFDTSDSGETVENASNNEIGDVFVSNTSVILDVEPNVEKPLLPQKSNITWSDLYLIDRIKRTNVNKKPFGDVKAFGTKVIQIAKRLGINPHYLMAIMYYESGIDPSIKNPKSSASGLIQFMNSTALDLGTTTKKLRAMTALKQLDYVEKYFYKNRHYKVKSFLDVYLIVFYPAAIRWSENRQFPSHVKKVNQIFVVKGSMSRKTIRAELYKKVPDVEKYRNDYISQSDATKAAIRYNDIIRLRTREIIYDAVLRLGNNAIIVLQKSLNDCDVNNNLVLDGIIGKFTLAAINTTNESQIVGRYRWNLLDWIRDKEGQDENYEYFNKREY